MATGLGPDVDRESVSPPPLGEGPGVRDVASRVGLEPANSDPAGGVTPLSPALSQREREADNVEVAINHGSPPRWAWFLLIFGLYLTLRGYHSFDGDQAYRLPLLLHAQDPALFATDPFVRAFDAFNPHRGYLTLLDWSSRPFGLAAALLGLFALTLVATSLGVDRLARAVWPEVGGRVGLIAVVLVLAAKAGNIGTNHLFEATLLDRLVGFALGWLALASAIGDPRRGVWAGGGCLGLATLVHPSVGLQLGLTLAAGWSVWAIRPAWSGVSRPVAIAAIGVLGLALAPGLALMAGQGGRLFEGLPPEEFRLLAVMVQGPQHMLPSTWRMPQWLAWGCYPTLALLAFVGSGSGPWPAARSRLAALMAVNLTSLGLAYLAVEVVGDVRVTVFQPFRMATLARGLALVAVSGRLAMLWGRGDLASRGRAVLIGSGLAGDWSLVVATAVDLTMAALEWASASKAARDGSGLAVLALGLAFLARHDTESGHVALLAGLGALGAASLATRRLCWTPRRLAWAMVGAWAVPASALAVPWIVSDPSAHGWSAGLVGRCRFAEVPADDLERLAVWARENTPASARFVGPPGPKTFRLWSRRPLAFNRAASPYHAEGLADWSGRYRDHVGFDGPTAGFVRAYLADRHALEARYGRLTDAGRAALALRQGATHVLAAARPPGDPDGPLELLRVEGRYAVYRVRTNRPREPEENSGKNSAGSLPLPILGTKTGP